MFIRRPAAAELMVPVKVIEDELDQLNLVRSPYRYTVLHELWLLTSLLLATPTVVVAAVLLSLMNSLWLQVEVPDWWIVAQMSPPILLLMVSGYCWLRMPGDRPLPHYDEGKFTLSEQRTGLRWRKAVLVGNLIFFGSVVVRIVS